MKRRPAIRKTRRLPANATAKLNEIGIALSRERNPERVLDLILTSARDLIGCDAGSLYLVRKKEGAPANRNDFLADKELLFTLAQNDSVDFPFKATPLPITHTSIAGHVAITGKPLNLRDAYRVPDDLPCRLSRFIDDKTGYRTVSMLTVPMANQKGELIGVLQLINRRKNPRHPLGKGFDLAKVLPFDKLSVDLAMSLASQATVAIENDFLYEEITRLFDVFVRASVSAIESRDPTTAGHSGRVAALTTGLARAVHAETAGPYASMRFTDTELRQIEYASLLHDFGKIGVREAVLVKAKKLYPEEFAVVEERGKEIGLGLRLLAVQKKLDLLSARADAGPVDAELSDQLARLQEDIQLIRKANEPSLLEESASGRLKQIPRETYSFPGCDILTLLSDREAERLGIRKGSLSEDERKQIESHVTHTYNYLKQIPWPRDLDRTPEIAWAHHEKVNGKGYPRGIAGEKIPVESRMMTIADIYDALTASDRPYKKAAPVEKALAILKEEEKHGALDPELLRIFIERRVYETALAPAAGDVALASKDIARV